MKLYKEYFTDNNLNDMYDRTIKLLNGANKDTYGFAPAEIQQLIKEIKGLKNNQKLYNEVSLEKTYKIDKALDYLENKFTKGLNYSEWTDGYNECINRHKSNLQNILKGDDINE